MTRRSSEWVHGPLPLNATCSIESTVNASFPATPAGKTSRPHPACQDAAPSIVYTPWSSPQYKLMTFNYAFGHPNPGNTGPSKDGFYSASSVDGIAFTDDASSNPALPTDYPRNPGDLAHFGYDYHRGEYHVTARQRMDDDAVPYCRPNAPGANACRCIGWATSHKWSHWSQPEPVICADEVDDRWVTNHSAANVSWNHSEFYNMPAFAYQQGYIGLLWVTRFGKPDKAAHNNEGTIHVEVSWSHNTTGNTTSWHRPGGTEGPLLLRPQLIPRGTSGAWDSDMVMTSNTPFKAVETDGVTGTALTLPFF